MRYHSIHKPVRLGPPTLQGSQELPNSRPAYELGDPHPALQQSYVATNNNYAADTVRGIDNPQIHQYVDATGYASAAYPAIYNVRDTQLPVPMDIDSVEPPRKTRALRIKEIRQARRAQGIPEPRWSIKPSTYSAIYAPEAKHRLSLASRARCHMPCSSVWRRMNEPPPITFPKEWYLRGTTRNRLNLRYGWMDYYPVPYPTGHHAEQYAEQFAEHHAAHHVEQPVQQHVERYATHYPEHYVEHKVSTATTPDLPAEAVTPPATVITDALLPAPLYAHPQASSSGISVNDVGIYNNSISANGNLIYHDNISANDSVIYFDTGIHHDDGFFDNVDDQVVQVGALYAWDVHDPHADVT